MWFYCTIQTCQQRKENNSPNTGSIRPSSLANRAKPTNWGINFLTIDMLEILHRHVLYTVQFL